MNLPADVHAYDPNFLCDLLDGLEAIPDSQWRAWLLEHDGAGGGSGSSERLQLGWLGFGQSEMLLLQLQNTLDSLRSLAVSHWSGKKVGFEPILPPGIDAVSRDVNRVDGSHVTSRADYMARVRSCFGG